MTAHSMVPAINGDTNIPY